MAVFRSPRILIITVVLLLIPATWFATRDARTEEAAITALVHRGAFAVSVSTSGELSARESVRIMGPRNTREARVFQMVIQSIVPEGTIVDSGDVVAELDRAPVGTRLAEVTLAAAKAQAVYEQAMLDSTLTLSQAREEIRSLDLALEEQRIAKEQAIYEPPSTQRKAEIDFQKAQRALAQAKLDYTTKEEQARAKMREVAADRDREQNDVLIVQQVMDAFTVRAPAPGMVIYIKEWNGRKRTVGSQVSAWDPAVATLPDLTQMESITYVNEIDIRKIAAGQPVQITLDADPSKHLTGTVTAVANVGEQRPNTDAKVFEVHITVQTPDTTLRPGMTTGNAIETFRDADALSVPIEALRLEDGVPFVYRRSGADVKKQEVLVGAMNDNDVIIAAGLEENDEVLLTPPADREGLAFNRLPDSLTSRGGEARPVGGGDTAITLPVEATPPPRN
jgi:HlyD family secretion protein